MEIIPEIFTNFFCGCNSVGTDGVIERTIELSKFEEMREKGGSPTFERMEGKDDEDEREKKDPPLFLAKKKQVKKSDGSSL